MAPLARIVLRAIFFVLILDAVYLVVQPLDQPGLTLYNHVIPGRLRFVQTNNTTSFMVNELRLSRLLADHVISRPKAPNEYRIVVLGGSEIWGFQNNPDQTMPALLSELTLRTPDGRMVSAYNLAYVYPDVFKDLMILDVLLNGQHQPDLVILTANPYTFQPIRKIHTLADYNPELALRVAENYELSGIPLDSYEIRSVKNGRSSTPRDLFAERKDVAAWLVNEAYGLVWAASGMDDPTPRQLVTQTSLSPAHTWVNLRPGVLEAILSLTRSRHLPLLIVSVPANYETAEYDRWLLEEAARLGVPLLDCSKLLPPPMFSDGGLHLTAEGQLVFTQKIAQWLQFLWSTQSLDQQIISACS